MKFCCLLLVLTGCAYSVSSEDVPPMASSENSSINYSAIDLSENFHPKMKQQDQVPQDPFAKLSGDDGVGADFGPATGCSNPPCDNPKAR